MSQRGNSYFAPTVTCRGIKCAPERAEVRHARSGAPDTLQYMSGVPPDIQAGPAVRAPTVGTQRPGDVAGAPDSVRCTRGLQAKLFAFGKIQRRFAIIHRTVRCTPNSVRCPRGERLWNSPASGIRSAIIYRTCPVYTGLSGEPAEQRLLRANGHLQKH